ncbi:SulP family inorganic anion transporter [Microbacterium sp. BK668]|uniref:SulP family inorganic anion transporter n=1 Tax=Microbacterium sp. BK668 TaxID=2512118 RepID=UPI0010D8AEC0|nr:SulP family inorganic anion transporter [Microbacterium sp. BK668]TDN90940.1 SulP family sulfate permease [Microbacterium sp. BK668]
MTSTTPARQRRRTLAKDAGAGVVLGVESVPDGLAMGLLAGVNPLAGLYAYLFGMVGAALFTSSSFMVVQATGAIALVVSDAGLQTRPDPERALFTLSMLTGLILLVAGLAQAGRLVRFVPTAVMAGFLTAVGINIILGQLANLTGYAAPYDNRVAKLIDTALHPGQWSFASIVVGVVTIAVIVLLQRTRVGGLGLVIAIVVGSGLAAALNAWAGASVALIGDLVTVPDGLPMPVPPTWDDLLVLAVPAFSIALICVVQGAGVSTGLPAPGGRRPDVSRDIVAQGAGNLLSGIFQGMPVGGSMGSSSLVVAAGAKSRAALFVAGACMVVVILFAADTVAYVAMPALAGLLIVIGAGAVKPARIYSVLNTGPLQTVIMAVTFVLTILIPLQFAVLVGVGLGMVLFVVQQSNRVRVRELRLTDDGAMREVDPVAAIAPGTVTVLQPYGSLFFASAPTLERQLPAVSRTSAGAVVILRLRGVDQIGLTTIDVLRRYAAALHDAGSTLKLVVSDAEVLTQIRSSGLAGVIGPDNLYEGSEWVGAAVRRAYADAREEVARA